MAPPSYSDLGKSARDLFSKGFNYGFAKLECKTKTENGVKLTTSGSGNLDTSKVTGELETEYEFSDYGLTFKEKWNTENVLKTEIKIEDQFAKGLKLSFDTSFAPHTGKKSGKIKTAYKMDYMNLNCDVDFDFAGPTVHGDAVMGYNGYMAGYQMSFDTSKSKLTNSNFALGYSVGDFTINTNLNDSTDFGGSIYQKVSDNLETGVQLSWKTGTNDTMFALGSKYTLDSDASINAKVNNQGQLGFGYTQKLRDGVKLTLSSMIEGKNINAGGHKLGLGLELEA